MLFISSMTTTQKVIAAAATTVLLWGSAFPGIKAGLAAYGPGQLALLRYLFASLTMAVIALVRSVGLPRLRDGPGIALLGVLGFTLYHGALNYGQVSVTAGSASFLTETAPVFATLMALVGGLLVLAGVALVQRLGDAEPARDAKHAKQREVVSA